MSMVQYGIWPNCCNSCQFCLRTERIPISLNKQKTRLKNIIKNIDYIDWQNEFANGISLLGGEIYYITDIELQNIFIDLIDKIIEKIIKPYDSTCYSSVTNGLYDPSFLYRVIDRFLDAKIDIQKRLDINFSYDLKYRFKTKKDADLVLKNINDFHNKYNYKVGIQMILTQYLIDKLLDGSFSISEFERDVAPGNMLCLLYPHPIATGIKLDDFNFKRNDFLKICSFLKDKHYSTFESFVQSTINSSKFKYTGLMETNSVDYKQKPRLTNDKIEKNCCGHSMLYKCYSDSSDCMLCDLLNFYLV